jgi:hypothetical protein
MALLEVLDLDFRSIIKHMRTRICPVCLEEKAEVKKNFRLSIGGKFRNVCRGCQEEVGYIQLKVEVFSAYGKRCACCGETNPLLLQLDHVNNDGKKHRHLIWFQLYRRIKQAGFPNDFQLLCGSCNWAKSHRGGCPHRSGRTTEKVWAEWEAILARKGKRYRNFQERQVDPDFQEKRPFKSEEMIGNQRFPKTRGKHGYFSKSEVAEGLKKIELESQ